MLTLLFNNLFKVSFIVTAFLWCIGLKGAAQLNNAGDSAKTESFDKSISAGADYIGVYQKFVSGIRGHECPMYPSCSNFGLKAFKERRFLAGGVLTCDRLMRCGHDHSNYPITLRNSGFKYLDYPAYDSIPVDLIYRSNAYFFAYADTVKDDSTILFIKNMMSHQYFREALIEIMRIEFTMREFNQDLFINKIICLKALGEYEKAIFDYETKCPENFKSDPELLYQIALIQFRLQNYQLAQNTNLRAIETCLDSSGWPKYYMLQGLIFAQLGDWNNAIGSYGNVLSMDPHSRAAEANTALAYDAIDFNEKKPGLAGTLSIIPGLGYAYSGHRQTALSAFLVNGLMAFATYSSFKSGNVGMGVLMGVFNLSFYIGNIYGSSKSAVRYNEQFRRNTIDKLKRNSNL